MSRERSGALATNNRRFLERERFNTSDRIFVEFKVGGDILTFTVEDLSSFGIKCFMPCAIGTTETIVTKWNLRKENEVASIRINVGSKTVGAFDKAIIVHALIEENRIVLGLAFSPSKDEQNTREHARVTTMARFVPTGTFDHTIHFDRAIHFRITDLSLGGFRAVVSARNRLLLRHSKIESGTISFPLIGAEAFTGFVRYVTKEPGSDDLLVGVEFENPSQRLLGSLSKYLLAFTNNEELAKEIFQKVRPKKIKHLFSFVLVSSTEEYFAVLNLRKEAYVRAGKIDVDTTASDMADIFDSHSRLIIAKFQGKVVGSVRVTNCPLSHQKFELESSITLPSKIDRYQVMEISRLCVAKEFENSDLVHGLFERVFEIALKLGVKYAFTSCETKLLRTYSRLGFYPNGITFELKTLKNLKHHFLLHDMRSSKYSSRLNPICWYYAFNHAARFYSSFGYYKLSEMPFYMRITMAIIGAIERLKRGFAQHK